MCVELQSVVTAFVTGSTPVSARAELEHESVVFRFGTGMRRFDLHVGFPDLERVAALVADAIQHRDAMRATEQERAENSASRSGRWS